MGIERINIRNFKSLKNIVIDFEKEKYDIQCIIGKNGAGKSSILDAINYFYKMTKDDSTFVEDYLDSYNRYIQNMQIEFVYNFEMLLKINSNNYIDNIIKELKPFTRNNKLLLRLTQYKDGTIEWFPQEKSIRKNLSKLFPIYMIDTRFITLHDWSIIWDIIGELSISNIKKDESEVEKILDELLDKIYGEKYNKSLEKIETIFNREAISVNKYNYNERFKNALFTRLGSSEFLSNDNKIGYYSDGTNSLKYIKLIVQLIGFLSETGWKNPLIIIDEPEIGLHPQYIEDLIECLYENKHPKVNLLLTTHSTNLVTSLIKNQLKVGLKRVFVNSSYTKLESIKDIIDIKDKFLISNMETECYFSNAILFVEGTSEMQLFQYPRFRELYKCLRYIKFYSCDSNNASLRIIHPNNNKYNVPFILLVDMDKILNYNYNKQKFNFHPDKLVNPLYNTDIINSQKLSYFNKYGRKYSTLNYYQYIKKTIKACTFEQNSSLFWLDNSLYNFLCNIINRYCSKYNVYAVKTTIEGCLVNIDNYIIVKNWLITLLEQAHIDKLNTLLELYDNNFYKVTILRLIFNGKFDNLSTLEEAIKGKIINKQFSNEINLIHKAIGKKTSGWIVNFLDYYFKNYLDEIKAPNEKLDKFNSDFKELNCILQMSQDMVKCTYDE